MATTDSQKFIYEDERIPHFIVTQRAMSEYSTAGKATSQEWRQTKILRNDEIDFGLVKRWINLCKHEHGAACNRSETGKSPAKRVLDVEKNCIVDGRNVDEYFTLSYAWGMAAQFMLTKDVLNDSTNEGFFSSIGTKIPQTIRDAMQVCRNIGVRYLWVDALCIVQDDEQDKSDQIGLMDEIYGHALAVLIVAAGDGAEHGIPGMGQQTRALVNCEEAVDAQSSDDWISVTVNDIPEDMDPKKVWKQYYDGLLAFYIRRNMKFDTDSLLAFSGILKVLSKRLGPFHHGLPKKYFGRSLLWNDAHHGIFERRKCFPSWSWAGWKWKFEFFDSQKTTVGAYGYHMPKESVPMKFSFLMMKESSSCSSMKDQK
ncbi:Heterokaryon incompatibility protein 6, OR allele [Madurella mycetomatis]|uniref:Heterokaryon incompatibility protein 6, OR allele n=1 Tax=Madurella mycetomatis TaxID=100816 RepID=A0A175W6F1_9PEZI|nr:Heterokaryon incompatibility protein 6, OR allele [Madurella mycetomatis]